jgi:hypothetical protein
MIQYGWIKDIFDPNDYLHKRKVAPIPDKYSNVDILPAYRRSQGSIGSCVGQAIGTVLDSVKITLLIFDEQSSATYIYNGARFMEGTLPIDCGTHPRTALEWSSSYGILLEHYWPYDSKELDTHAPSSEKIKQAVRYKKFQYYRCVDGIEGLCDAIYSGHLIGLGSPWFGEWESSPPCGRLPVPTNKSFMVGGHETVLYEYDKIEGVFKGANSWGDKWGDGGLYIMPFESIEVFKDRGGYDAHYVAFSAEIDTSPPPDPNPSTCILGKGFAEFLNKFFLLEERGRKGRFYYK